MPTLPSPPTTPLRRLVAAVNATDIRAYSWVAAHHARGLGRVLPPLSRAANHGVLWAGVATALQLSRRPRLRRAAIRGGLAISLASPVANVAAKGLVRRPRPATTDVPVRRMLRRAPHTTSFPSGHSASAAAFAVAAALESPAAAVPVAALAGAVAFSRVYVGVHYPGDVLGGVALGAGAAWATTRIWPVKPRDPARAAPDRFQAPALPEGEGLVVVLNAKAGAGRGPDPGDELLEILPKATLLRVGPDDDLLEVVERAASTAAVLGVAGGDGTVQCAVLAARRHDLPLAVLPAGTLNHFAADLGVRSVADTARAVQAGEAVQVDVGTASGGGGPDTVWINTASIGGYPEMVAAREQLEDRLGKWPAMVVALARVLLHGEPEDVEVDGRRRRVWLLFAGLGRYHPEGFAPAWRERLDGGLLDLRIIDATHPLARTRLVAAVLLGRLGRSRVYQERTATSVRIGGRGAALHLARDGEVEDDGRTELTLGVDRRALVVYRPADAQRP